MPLASGALGRSITDIEPADELQIRAFMQGAIYCWCKNVPKEWFAVRDLMGGVNFFWQRTPLIALFNKHTNQGKDHKAAINGAAVDLGWIVKSVLEGDPRTFLDENRNLVAHYRWDGEPAPHEVE